MPAPSGYQFVEHTADIGVHAWGPDMATVLIQAAYAVRELLTGGASHTGEPHDVPVHVTADDVTELVVTWLQEVLMQFELHRQLPDRITMPHCSATSLEAIVHTIQLGPDAELHGHEVKAVTYHGLQLQQTHAGYTLDCILDI